MPKWLSEFGRFLWELVKIISISIALIVPIRVFLVQPFYVQGASMYPSFIQNDYLLVDEITYGVRNPLKNNRVLGGRPPERGEVVVFRCEKSECGNSKGDYLIKRVIGLPRETIVLKNGKVHIRTEARPTLAVLQEPYIATGHGYFASEQRMFALGADEYFLLGDNRDVSFDSEDFGPIPLKAVIGRVWLRGWPFSRIGPFLLPAYTE